MFKKTKDLIEKIESIPELNVFRDSKGLFPGENQFRVMYRFKHNYGSFNSGEDYSVKLSIEIPQEDRYYKYFFFDLGVYLNREYRSKTFERLFGGSKNIKKLFGKGKDGIIKEFFGKDKDAIRKAEWISVRYILHENFPDLKQEVVRNGVICYTLEIGKVSTNFLFGEGENIHLEEKLLSIHNKLILFLPKNF